MARYVQDVVLNKPDDFVHFIMNDYLQKNGFSMSDWKGEPAYRAGDPMLEGYKYLKYTYVNGTFHLEAWLKGSMGGEWDLDGFVGVAMKAPYKKNLTELINVLQQTIPQPNMSAPAAGTDGATAATAAPTPIAVQTVDNHKAATWGLIFGILTIVLCWSPIFCILCAVLGFSRCRMGQGSSKAGQAKAGKICCIVGIAIMIVLFVLNFVLTVLTATM